ncbi:MAG: hypothetical protein L7S49_01130, partial [Candidatus Poseidoniaceae archaeon]|nr:hypothetical protein [Candidatus Poseidoniaceae archaeon]
EKDVIDYRIITGNSVEIGDLTIGDGWISNGRIKKVTVAKNTTHSGTLRVSGSGAFTLRLAVKVSELGDWVLDLNLPDSGSND